AVGHIRTEVGKRIRLRLTPELSIHLDESLDYSTRIQELLLKIKEEEGNQ
ncbi:MAG TPA: ribosome-binding factor A, partial [Negativicutes bacterium]